MSKVLVFLFVIIQSNILSQEKGYWPEAQSITGPEITPGKILIPKKMKRPQVFVLAIDYETRIGKFRSIQDGSIIEAQILPHAELLYKGSNGNLEDFQKYEHVFLRLHPDNQGKWRLASYIKGNIRHQYSHKEYWDIKSVDQKTGKVVGEIISPGHPKGTKGPITFYVNKDTNYWQNGEKVDSNSLKVGSRVNARTHCSELGTEEIAWDVMLDYTSIEKVFIAPQLQRISAYEKEKGVSAYIDSIENKTVTVTVFRGAAKRHKSLKAGRKVRLAAASWNLEPVNKTLDGVVTYAKYKGAQGLTLKLALEDLPVDFKTTKTARVWLALESL